MSNSLSISTSNVLIDQVPTILNDAGVVSDNNAPSNLSDPDHSLNYTSGSNAGDFTISYGPQVGISYVAISGHNAAIGGPVTVQLYNDSTLMQQVTLSRNNNMMFTFTERAFIDLKIKFVTTPSTKLTTVSYIAAGKNLSIPTGEQGGYKRLWLMRHMRQTTTTNLLSAPVSTIKKPKTLKGSLSLPNTLKGFSELEWQDFIDFTEQQPFFIKEQVSSPQSSYVCFDANHTISAHGSTRSLNALTLAFSAYNGV